MNALERDRCSIVTKITKPSAWPVFFSFAFPASKKAPFASESFPIPESYQLGPFANVFLFWWKVARKKRVTNPDLSFCSWSSELRAFFFANANERWRIHGTGMVYLPYVNSWFHMVVGLQIYHTCILWGMIFMVVGLQIYHTCILRGIYAMIWHAKLQILLQVRYDGPW